MKNFLRIFLTACAVAVVLWAITSCRASRATEQGYPNIPVLPVEQTDSVSPVTPQLVTGNKPGLLQRIFGTKPAKFKGTYNYYAPGSTVTTVGKKATAATAEGATAIGKAKGQTVTGDSSTTNAVTGGGALATVNGNGNQLEQKPTTKEAEGWAAKLTGPLGYVLAAAVVAGLIALYLRRKASLV